MEPLVRLASTTSLPAQTSYLGSFRQAISTDSVNKLTSLRIQFTSATCVSGITFVYSDGTTVITGYSYSSESVIDLVDAQLYAVNSLCGIICDHIQVCTVNVLTSAIVCVDSGTTTPLVTFNDTSDFKVTAYHGDYVNYYGWQCMYNLGIDYV